MRYFIEIKKKADGYQAAIHTGSPESARILNGLELGENSQVKIKGRFFTFGKLIEALVGYQKQDLELGYDERGQLEIGMYLYNQIFGHLSLAERKKLRDSRTEIRIVTNDEHITRIPWVLLSEDDVFLSTEDMSISLSHTSNCIDCSLPYPPKILVVAPEPVNSGLGPTGAEAHINDLESRLSIADPRLSRNNNLYVVSTWEGFLQAVARYQPHVIYYYGHGVGDLDKSRLVFASGEERGRVDKSIVDLGLCLRKSPPLLVYLNCCLGDSGGLLGAGLHLRKFVPVVITNRTIAQVKSAQVQALSLLESLLLEGAAPHVALAEMHRKLPEMELSLSDVRWITPVLHCSYGNWKTSLPLRPNPPANSQWRTKLNRDRQLNEIIGKTVQMLRESNISTFSCLWYGQDRQGVEHFGDVLKTELVQDISQISLFQARKPEWPTNTGLLHNSFEEMLKEGFGVDSLDKIPSRIREDTVGVAGKQTLICLIHTPVRYSGVINIINTNLIKTYLEWLDCNVAPLLQKHRLFALIGFSTLR